MAGISGLPSDMTLTATGFYSGSTVYTPITHTNALPTISTLRMHSSDTTMVNAIISTDTGTSGGMLDTPTATEVLYDPTDRHFYQYGQQESAGGPTKLWNFTLTQIGILVVLVSTPIVISLSF